MAYTTTAKIEGYLNSSIPAGQQAQLSQWISAVTRFIDNYTQRTFEQVVAETRYFDGNGESEILIDDFLSLTEVSLLESDGTVLQTLTEGDASDYITYPYTTTPKYKLIMRSTSSQGKFWKGVKNLKVVGTWNFSTAVPADIELVATRLVSTIIIQGQNSNKDVVSESLGDYSVTYGQSVEETFDKLGLKSVLDQYIIYEF